MYSAMASVITTLRGWEHTRGGAPQLRALAVLPQFRILPSAPTRRFTTVLTPFHRDLTHSAGLHEHQARAQCTDILDSLI